MNPELPPSDHRNVGRSFEEALSYTVSEDLPVPLDFGEVQPEYEGGTFTDTRLVERSGAATAASNHITASSPFTQVRSAQDSGAHKEDAVAPIRVDTPTSVELPTPVKLQTSRRLSSGELLTTIQDNKETLEDIREGDYIVGRKEKRNSQLSQIKTSSPLLVGPASPPIQSSAATVTPRESSVPEQKQWLAPPTPLWQSDVSYSPGLTCS